MRSPILASILLFSVLLAAALGAFFLLQDVGHKSPLEMLPGDTSLALHTPDLELLSRELLRTGLAPGATAAPGWEEDRSDLVADVLSRAARRWRIPVELAPERLGSLSMGEAALALVPVSDEAPGIALLVSASGSDAWAAKTAALSQRAPMDAHGGIWTSHEHRGRPYSVLWLPEGAAPVCVTGLKGVIVVTTSRGVMRRILDTAGGRLDPLRSTVAFRRIRDALGRRGELRAFASGEWTASAAARVATRFLDPGNAEKATSAVRLLGLDALRGAGLAVIARPGFFQERLVLALEPSRRGLLSELFDAPTRPMPTLRSLPSGFPYYAAFSFGSLDVLYRKLPELLASGTGTDPSEVRARLDGLEEFLAVDIARDLLAAVRGEVLIGFGASSVYPRGASGRALLETPAVASLSLSGGSGIRKLLRRADGLARAAGALHISATAGEPIISYRLTALAPLQPAYRLQDAMLLAATSPDLLLGGMGTAARPVTIPDRIDDVPFRRALPGKAHVYFWGETERLMDQLRTGDEPWDRENSPAPEWMFDRLEALLRRSDLPATAMAARITQTGLVLDWVSPVSPSLLALIRLSSAAGDRGIQGRQPGSSESGSGGAGGNVATPD